MPRKKKIPTEPTLPFAIGADPEFLMFFGTRGLDASSIIQSFFKTNPKYQYDGDKGYDIPNVGNFGWDGASSTGELRPVATRQIKTMVDNIGTMLKTITDKIPTVDLTTLSIGAPIGGHIHVDDFLHEFSRGEAFITNRSEFLRATNVLSTYLLPLAASDHRVSALNRLKGNNYGRLTDYRFEPKGNVITAEIRGLTAEWMTTPELTYATFAYIATVWNEIKKRNLELSKDDFITRTKEQNETLQKMLLTDFKIIERGLTASIRKSIKKFELYPQFQKEIDFILHPEEVMKHKAAVGWNINTGWGLTECKKPTKKALLSKTFATKKLREQYIPDVHEHFALMYNDDYHVAMFSTAIAERIAALNWQLKNDYFLFGFKKDTEGFGAMSPDGKMFVMPSNKDKNETKDIMRKMQERAIGRYTARIDPKTGQIRRSDNSRKIIIGIPYKDREAQDPRNLIELIYNIETKKITPKEISQFEVNVVAAKDKEVTLSDAIPTQNINYSKYEVGDLINNNSELTM